MGKTVWIIVGVVILLLIAGYFMFSGDDSANPQKTSGSQSEVDQATARVIDNSVVAEDDDVELGEVIE